MKRLIRKANLSSDIEQIINNWLQQVEENDYNPTADDELGEHNEELQNLIPYPILDWGSGRMVFDMGDKVLKIATTKEAILNTYQEGSVYDNAPDSLKKHLAKVFDYNDGWIVMEKITKDVPQTEEYYDKIYDLEEDLEAAGINPVDLMLFDQPHEPHWENLKLNEKNEIVIVDYAGFH